MVKQITRKVANLLKKNLQRSLPKYKHINRFPKRASQRRLLRSSFMHQKYQSLEIQRKILCCLSFPSRHRNERILTYDSATTENDEMRLSLDVAINKKFQPNYQNFATFNQGISIEVCQMEPKMIKDPQTFELKPEIKNNSATMNVTVLGGTRIDLIILDCYAKKQQKMKYVLFYAEAFKSALLYDPYQDQKEIVAKKKQSFQIRLKKLEEERLKKKEEQEQFKQQNKGAKDQKKTAEKKPPAKKDGKEAAPILKKKSEKCDFPIDTLEYRFVDEQKMFKGKQLLCVSINLH